MTKALQITTEITNQICEKLMSGVPLTRICEAKDLPSLSTVHRLINKDPSFAKQIIQARKVGCQFYLDKMIDEAIEKWIERHQ